MAQSRMPSGAYKKKLLRLPPDILEILEKEAIKEDRSLNGQLVHILRKYLPADAQDHAPLATATP
jgi:hypothetical protein